MDYLLFKNGITVTGVNNGISGYFEDLTSDSNYRVYENFISVLFYIEAIICLALFFAKSERA